MSQRIIKILPLLILLPAITIANEADISDEFDPMHEMYMDEISEQDDMPVVLTAARLKQPKNEVPASVTVITAKQIKAWGVRRIPELMRFVPGMFVGHGDELNNPTVLYHAGSPDFMRRMQVLVDGRSVYKSALANVIWDDIPVAIEDIARIEVVRGPNGATYGANAFSAVINIISKHPDDSLGSRVLVRQGSDEIRDVQVSSSHRFDATSMRITAQASKDGGFDGNQDEDKYNNFKDDNYRDGSNYHFINSNIRHEISAQTHLDVNLAYKSGYKEISKEDLHFTAPDTESEIYNFSAKLEQEFSSHHKSQLFFSWQRDNSRQSFTANGFGIYFDPDMKKLYDQNPLWARSFLRDIVYNSGNVDQASRLAIVQGIGGGADVATLTTAIEDVYLVGGLSAQSDGKAILASDFSQADLELTQKILLKANQGAGLVANLSTPVYADTEVNLDQDKIDLEWQDTMVWNEYLTTVSGLSFRHDKVYSKTYFDGGIKNNLYRLFINTQYRASDQWLFNFGGTYEVEDTNGEYFSPRFAVNYLIDNQQSLRLVVAQAFRTPDLLESKPNYSFSSDKIGDNYLGISSGSFYASLMDDVAKDITAEKIISYELGYYLNRQHVEVDIKAFYERLYDLIPGSINLYAQQVSNRAAMNIDGIEVSVNTPINRQHSILWTSSYINVDLRNPEQRDELAAVRNTAENSNLISYIFSATDWTLSATAMGNFTYADDQNQSYKRLEVAVRHRFRLPFVEFEVSAWNQHNFQLENVISRTQQVNDNKNIFYLGLTSEF